MGTPEQPLQSVFELPMHDVLEMTRGVKPHDYERKNVLSGMAGRYPVQAEAYSGQLNDYRKICGTRDAERDLGFVPQLRGTAAAWVTLTALERASGLPLPPETDMSQTPERELGWDAPQYARDLDIIHPAVSHVGARLTAKRFGIDKTVAASPHGFTADIARFFESGLTNVSAHRAWYFREGFSRFALTMIDLDDRASLMRREDLALV